jgi:hypothetical protein
VTRSMLARSLYNGLAKRWYTHIFAPCHTFP